MLIRRSHGIDEHQLIPLVKPGNRDNPLYAMDSIADSNLLKYWHEIILEGIERNLGDFNDEPGLNAVHLFRQGVSEEFSIPTILVSINDMNQKEDLRRAISVLFGVSQRESMQISFDISKVRRTVNLSSQPPPICKARNTAFQQYPRSGASIGIRNRDDCTATLGGFLVVDGRPLVLTVNHIDEDQCDEPIFLTHPSEQECYSTSEWRLVGDCLDHMRLCCRSCQELRIEHLGPGNTYKPVNRCKQICLVGGSEACGHCPKICYFDRTKAEVLNQYPREHLGQLFSRSLTRSRRCTGADGEHFVEMDWALFQIDQWPHPLWPHVLQEGVNLQFHRVVPGASIKASGRTSGVDQIGLIHTAKSLIHQGGRRFTREWIVIRDPSVSREAWITGGIGVDGDSGAWIVDRDGESLYGMAWGRHQAQSNTFCLFTPIEHIVADIKEWAKAQDVCLPTSESATVDSGKGKMPAFETSTVPLMVTMKPQPGSDISMEQEILDLSSSNVR